MGTSQNNNKIPTTTAKLPVISRIIPAVGDIVGGTSISVRGAYFENGSNIFIGNAECLNIQFVAASEIKCTTPASSVGRIDVKIENPNGDEYTLSDGFEYVDTALAITGPNGGVDFVTSEQGQMVHGTCTKNITNLLSNIGTFVDDDCSDGTWSLETYSLDPGANTFTISGTTPDAEASASDSIDITYVNSGIGALEIVAPNAGVNFSTNVQDQTIYGTCSTDVVNLSSTLGSFSDDDCADGNWALDVYSMSLGANNFVVSGLDGSGSPVSDSISITYDNVAPLLLITAPNAGTDFVTSNISQTISGVCGTDVVSISTTLGGLSDSNCSDGVWSLAPYALSPGTNTFTVTAYDEAGNETEAIITVTYDNANYSLSITAPNNGINLNTNVLSQTVSGTCTVGLTNLSSTFGSFADDNCSDGTWSLSAEDLVNGVNTITISGLTPAGNTVSDTMVVNYDTAGPSVAITAPNAGSSFATAQQVHTISGTCSADVESLTTSLGYFADNDCSDGTWSLTPTVLASGNNLFNITAYDSAGNHTNASITIIYDDVPASLQITSPNGGGNFVTSTQSQTISGTCTIDVSNLTTSLGTFVDSDCSDGVWSLAPFSLSPGNNTFTISGEDNLGNNLSTTMAINYDSVPPTLSITSPNGGLDLTTNVLVQTVSGSCGTDVVSMTTSLGNFADSNCSNGTWSLNAKVLQPGLNTFTIMAYDGAGNASTASISIEYDDTPAVLNITAPNGGASFITNSQLQTISGTCTADVSALATTVGSFADDDCSDGAWSLAPYSLSAGVNTIQVSGHDNMNNPLSSSINITYDQFAPAVSVVLPSNSGSYTTHSIIETVSGTCSSDVVNLTTSNGVFEHIDCATTGTWSLYPFLLTQGDNLFDIVAFDSAGNFSNSTLTITYNYVPSSLRVTGPNNGLNFVTNVQPQIVHGTCSGDMVNIATSLGTIDASNCSVTGEWWLTSYALASGANTFTITGQDYLGNTLTDSITITYDTAAPSISITAPNAGLDFATGQQVQTISGTCSADVTSITANNGILINTDCAGTGTWSSSSHVLVAGVNALTVTAHNVAGNTSSATITVTYNYAPSSLQITAPNNGLSFITNVLSQTIHGTCSTDMTDVSTTLGTLSDNDCSNGTWSLSPYDLNVGANTFSISGKDYLGNTITDTVTVTYDATVPSVAVTSPNAGTNFTTAQQAQTVSGTCSADVVSIATSKGSVLDADCAGTGIWHLYPYVLSVGANTFNITATNSAGSSSSAAITITYDNDTYSLHITSPNLGSDLVTNVQSQTVSGTCTAGITGLTSTLGTFADSNCTDGTWSLDPHSLSNGVNTFTISGTDPAGNITSDTIAITYDTTPPSLTILAPNSGADLSTYTLIQSISGTCSTDVVSLQTTKGSFADNNCSDGTWSLNDAVMSSGLNTFTITVADAAGNTDIKTINITYYATPAFIHILSPNSTLYTNSMAHTISGSCSHELTNLTTNVGSFVDSNCADGTWSLSTTSLVSGLNTITVSGKDAVNNTVSASVDIHYDTLAPTLSITAPNAGSDLITNGLVQTVSGLCGADVVSITTSLGSFADSNCLDGTWSLNPAIMSLGVNAFTIIASDLAGNSSIATINITFDDIAPNAPTVSSTSPTTDTTPTWSWSSGGGAGNGTYRYKLDSSDLNSGATETTATSYTPDAPISAGVHVLYVQEKDNANNWSLSGSSTIDVETCNTAMMWGRNVNGQLGINVTLPFRTTPTAVPNLTNVSKVSAGTGSFVVARKTDGTVWAWGTNDSGQLGDGSFGTKWAPQQVIGLSGISDVYAGSAYAIALKNDGTVWAWGAGASNQMGDGTATAKVTPVKVPSLSGISKINTSQGSSHAMAIASDNTVWAWGLNTSSELGDGTATARTAPVHVINAVAGVGVTVSSVSGNGALITVTTTTNHGLATGNQVVMAGWTGGTGVWNGTYAITVTGLTTFTYAATGNGTPTGGTAIANTWATVPLTVSTVTGNGTTVTVTTSVAHGLTTGLYVAMYGWTGGTGVWTGNYAVTVTGTTTFTYTATGNGTATGGTAIGSNYLSNVTEVASGTSHSVVLKGDGTVWAWGLGTSGQLGNNASLSTTFPVQVQVSGGAPLANITAIAAGTNFNLALKNDGTLWSWGLGTSGQLGDNTIVTKNYAVQVKSTEVGGFLTNVSKFDAGTTSAIVVKGDGTVWAWGINTSYQLGDGTVTQRNQAVQQAGISDATQVTMGPDFALMTTTANTVRAWGAAGSSQLAIEEINRYTPTSIYGLENEALVDLSAGTSFSLAVKSSDGTVWAWGLNTGNQLGDNTVIQRNTPVQVHGVGNVGYLSGITDVVASTLHSLALKSDGTVYGWGTNTNGRIGDNTATTRAYPVQVKGTGGVGVLSDVTDIHAGTAHSVARKSDGTVWAWGLGTSGQLGDNTIVSKSAPVQVTMLAGTAPLTDVTAIASASGAGHTLALRSDGTVWAWGLGTNGQLGDGSAVTRSSAVQVMNLTDVIAISAGTAFSMALKSDGTVWTWGLNTSYQLGDGTVTQRNQPVIVPGLNGITRIAGGSIFSLALKNDGTVWAWGALTNNYGYIGDGTAGLMRPFPVQVEGLDHVSNVHAGDYHSGVIVNCSY